MAKLLGWVIAVLVQDPTGTGPLGVIVGLFQVTHEEFYLLMYLVTSLSLTCAP